MKCFAHSRAKKNAFSDPWLNSVPPDLLKSPSAVSCARSSLESPFVRKVLLACEKKGLTYEDKVLVPFPKTPEFIAMNPLGKIPILEISDGRFIADSSVICAYLEKVHPEPALMPDDLYQSRSGTQFNSKSR